MFDLLLNVFILMVSDLLGDQRTDYLPSDLYQLARSKVVLEHPVINTAFITCRFR